MQNNPDCEKKKALTAPVTAFLFMALNARTSARKRPKNAKKKWREHSYRSNSPGTDPDRKNAYLQKSLDGVAHLAIFGNTTCAAMSFSDIL